MPPLPFAAAAAAPGWLFILIQVLSERHLVEPSLGPMMALKWSRSPVCRMVVRSENVSNWQLCMSKKTCRE
jgi:hypothetical protein